MTKNNTTIYNDNGTTRIIFHNTAIVSFTEDMITLNTGSWQTVTTKKRMNEASKDFGLNYTVFQKDFEWYVSHNNETKPFYDGITLTRHN